MPILISLSEFMKDKGNDLAFRVWLTNNHYHLSKRTIFAWNLLYDEFMSSLR